MKFSHINTWIFDLDDTLYSPETGFSKQMEEKQRAVLCELLGVSLDEIRTLTAGLREKYGCAAFTGLHRDTDLNMEAFIEQGFDMDYSLLPSNEEGATLLEKLAGEKVVFTNSPVNHAENSLKALGFEHIFKEIFDVTRLNFATKPSLEAFTQVVTALGVNPENCVMVEDRLENLKVAKSLGMTTIFVNGDISHGEAYVDFTYPTLMDFLRDTQEK